MTRTETVFDLCEIPERFLRPKGNGMKRKFSEARRISEEERRVAAEEDRIAKIRTDATTAKTRGMAKVATRKKTEAKKRAAVRKRKVKML